MPNFKLGTNIREHITRQLQALTTNRVAHACANFPLTTAEIQAAVMKPSHLKTMRELVADGLSGLPTSCSLAVHLSPEYLPGLQRDVSLRLSLPEEIYVPKESYGYRMQTAWSEGEVKCHLRLDVGSLDDDERVAVAAWANRVVRECRLRNLTQHTIIAIVDQCNTVADVAAWAPVVATLVTDQFWVKRFRNPPSKLKRYGPHPDTRAAWAKRLEAAEVVITGGQLLTEHKHPEKTVQAYVCSWKPLESDPPNT